MGGCVGRYSPSDGPPASGLQPTDSSKHRLARYPQGEEEVPQSQALRSGLPPQPARLAGTPRLSRSGPVRPKHRRDSRHRDHPGSREGQIGSRIPLSRGQKRYQLGALYGSEVPSCAACSMTTTAARNRSEGGRTYWASKGVLTYLHSKSLILSNAMVTSPRALMVKWNTALKVRSSSESDSPWRIK
jgi:hypothetical protein